MASSYEIRVVVDPTGAVAGTRRVKRELDDTGNSATRLRGLIAKAFAFAGVSFGIRELIRLSDGYLNLQNRIRTVTSSTAEMQVVTKKLYDISLLTRTSFTTTAEVYVRTAAAVQRLGKSQQDLLEFQVNLNKAVALSGASQQEASNALIQLSQGLASGTLRGEELRSVLEQLPIVADLIAKKFNTTRAGLRALGNAGKLAGDQVFDAIHNGLLPSGESLNELFSRIKPTIGGALTNVETAFTRFIGELTQTSGVAEGLANVILYVADNIEIFGRIALAVGGVIASALVAAGIGALVGVLGSLGVILVTSIALLLAFSDKIYITNDGITTLYDLIVVTGQALGDFAVAAADALDINTEDAQASFKDLFEEADFSFSGIIRGALRVVDTIIGYYAGMIKSIISLMSSVPSIIGGAFRSAVNLVIESIQAIPNAVIDALNAINKIGGGKGKIANIDLTLDNGLGSQLNRAGINAQDAFLSGFLDNQPLVKGFDNLMDDAAKHAEKRIAAEKADADARGKVDLTLRRDGAANQSTPSAAAVKEGKILAEANRDLDKQAELLRYSNQEREIQNQLLTIEDQLNRRLTPNERAYFEAKIRSVAALQDQRKLLDDIHGPQEELIRQQAALNELLRAGAINQEEFNNKLRDLKIAALEVNRDLESGLQLGLLKIGQQFGDISKLASETLVNAFGRAEDAIVEFTKTGKFSFSDFADSIIEDLIRLQVRSSITGPLANFLGSMDLSSIFSTTTNAPLDYGPFLPGTPGFATGGSFMVGGSGSSDTTPVSFRATKGEMVHITKGGQSGMGGNVQVIINNNASNTEAKTRETDDGRGGKRLEVMIDEVVGANLRKRGSQTNKALTETFGAKQQLAQR